jgi:GDP-D-mannose dehydratase
VLFRSEFEYKVPLHDTQIPDVKTEPVQDEKMPVEEFVKKALHCAGLEPSIERYVDFDKKMIRPSEVDLLIGDATKARRNLDWRPRVDFDQLVEKMVNNDLSIESDK